MQTDLFAENKVDKAIAEIRRYLQFTFNLFESLIEEWEIAAGWLYENGYLNLEEQLYENN